MRATTAFLTLFAIVALLTACGGGDDATETPTPDEANTATVSATATVVDPGGGTPTSEATVGSSAPLTAQSVAEADGVRVVLLQITDDWHQPSGQPAAPSGSRYVQIAVTVENHSDRAFTVGYDSFEFVAGEETSPGIKIGGAEPYLGRQDLPPEAAIQGFVVGVIPDAETLTGIHFDADGSTSVEVVFGE